MHLTIGNTIQGIAGTGSVITYTISGTGLGDGGVIQILETGQLGTSNSTLFTATKRISEIHSIILANTSTSSVSDIVITLNGSANSNQIVGELIIPEKGTATFSQGVWAIIDATGATAGTGGGGGGGIVSVTLTGDVTGTYSAGTIPAVLPNINFNVGSFGSGSLIPVITANAKGQITAMSTIPLSSGYYFQENLRIKTILNNL